MAESFTFELVSPERLLVSQPATQVVLPGSEGEMTVLADHAPVMTTIRPGIVTVQGDSGSEDQFVVFGGFADILPDSCTVLAEAATPVGEMNKDDMDARIESARHDAERAGDDAARTKAEDYLQQLTTLQGAVLPA